MSFIERMIGLKLGSLNFVHIKRTGVHTNGPAVFTAAVSHPGNRWFASSASAHRAPEAVEQAILQLIDRGLEDIENLDATITVY